MKKEEVNIIQKQDTLQEWIPIERIFDNGIIKLKNKKYIKIIQVLPINFNLKSDLEKQAILNSYKIFLKTCNFDIQILIQSNKADLSKNISNIEINIKNKEENFLREISQDYINYINNINSGKNSSSKNFFIVISSKDIISENINSGEIIQEELNERFFKIKECLSRCGNIVNNISDKNEIKDIIYSFFNSREHLN